MPIILYVLLPALAIEVSIDVLTSDWHYLPALTVEVLSSLLEALIVFRHRVKVFRARTRIIVSMQTLFASV